ncbi:MAG TPA: glycoside hydrolase family 15 protein [Gemmatimonadales bacterium]|nr:glycoside hydrolase family 15 protein [Gemmatimonadales bacterium]
MNGIQDYAAIGDGRSVALVGRDGSIDWLCWPRFDSPSVFGALLDPTAGRWRIAPVESVRTERHYIRDTNVLQTRFETDSGVMVLTDLMPVASEEDKTRLLLPESEILRLVECERGEIEIEWSFEPRPGYGLKPARIHRAGKLGIRAETGAGLLALRTDLPVEIGGDGRVGGRAHLSTGDVAHASLTFASDGPAVLPPLGEWSRAALERTVQWWQRWAARARYDGPCREMVIRSALALKLMVYAPSGAVIAAPTTSLPERIGGPLNWDYRFCWLRDASLTVRALVGLGYADEAHAFVNWLLHATRLTEPELNVLYDVHGNKPPAERVLDWLTGYRESRPVRIGNLAAEQLQLDVYGEVIDAVTHFLQMGGTLDRETERVLRDWGEYVCRHWDQPDEGIWEPRTGRAHHTHSRVLCWVALDRLLHLHEKDHIRWAPAAMFEKNRELLRREIEARAWNPALESYVAELDGDRLDATLLLLAWYGFEAAGSERMQATYHRIRDGLGSGDGLLYRYQRNREPRKEGEPVSPGEGAFGICSFWGVEYLALGGGTVDETRELFERLCRYANDVGLFAEEIDPATGAALGNFPQAFTHVGLINAALSLARRMEGEAPIHRGVPHRQEVSKPEKVRV